MTGKAPLISDQLKDKLVDQGIVPGWPTKCTIERIRLTRETRAAGGWQWSASWQHKNADHTAGSKWSMRACLDAPLLLIKRDADGTIHVSPRQARRRGEKQFCPVCWRLTVMRLDGLFRAHRINPDVATQCPMSQHDPGYAPHVTLDRTELYALLLTRPDPNRALLAADRYARHELEARNDTD